MSEKWTVAQIPDQTGRTAVVTGASSGLGAVMARELARAGADVVLACRDIAKGEGVADSIRGDHPTAKLSVEELDLASICSVRLFADRLSTERERLDLLVNNAGVMVPPQGKTLDGFELQFGTNHLGHFALTGLLLELLGRGDGARIVTVSSNRHKTGRIDFDDLQHERRYRGFAVYSQSKLANLLFAFELDRRLRAAGSPLRSVAAHPGFAVTNLQVNVSVPLPLRPFAKIVTSLLMQSAEMGALPLLYAATAPGLEGGTYYGPDGFIEAKGYPKQVKARPAARDEEVAKRLWAVSEELTGVRVALT